MVSFFIDNASTVRRPISLSPSVARGATGTIHRVPGEPGIVVKLYTASKHMAEYREKIAAMLAAVPNLPPFSHHGRPYVQIAWPTAGVIDGYGEFRGFVMPEVNLDVSTVLGNILQKSARKSKRLPEFYGARVLLAANLAALMAELHVLGHYMVDMKPANMRFYPQACYMAILDTDGFSIRGDRRLPARHYSEEYIAPEAQGKKPEQLGLQQDLFAMAIIIFRLLNNGIHPYQGIDVERFDNPTTLQDCIFAGLYAYGWARHRRVKPLRASIHEFLEDQTRELFDRAFTPGQNCPTAAEWRDHLSGLVKNKTLLKCSKNPNDHAHFSKGCGLCALEQGVAGGKSATARTPARRQPIQSSAAILATISTALTGGGSSPSPATVFMAIGALLLGFYALYPRQQQSVPAPPKSNPKISNLISGQYFDGSNDLRVVSSVFAGTASPVITKVDYQDAKIDSDYIEFKLTDAKSNAEKSCGKQPIPRNQGSLYCSWYEDAGEYRVSVYLNDKLDAEAATTFRIIPDMAKGTGCKSPLISAIAESKTWGRGCSIGNGRWRYWCTDGKTFDYPEDQPLPPGVVQAICGSPVRKSRPPNSQLIPRAPTIGPGTGSRNY